VDAIFVSLCTLSINSAAIAATHGGTNSQTDRLAIDVDHEVTAQLDPCIRGALECTQSERIFKQECDAGGVGIIWQRSCRDDERGISRRRRKVDGYDRTDERTFA
jgi:hypothetical protein